MDDKEKLVIILKKDIFNYPSPPFNPPKEYPELKTLPYKIKTDPANDLYGMIRKIFLMYKLDCANYGTEKWNPLSEIISKGNTVVIKPNLVRDKHPIGERAVLSTITHASLLRTIIDYIILALKGRGIIIVCDAPLQSTNFNRVCEINGLSEIINFYRSKVKNIQVSLLDLRKEMMVINYFRSENRIVQLKGDPLGYTIIDLRQYSLHSEIHRYWKKYVVTGYDLKNLRKYHTTQKHCYLIPNTILQADVIISVPKLKTHKKAGITIALKNSIGVNASKDFLPHHRMGTPLSGGDEYPHPPSVYTSMKNRLAKIITNIPIVRVIPSLLRRRLITRKIVKKYEIREGNWYGNDTLFRTILDLNVIIKYADKTGVLKDTPQRNLLFLVDGIVGQEGEGPMSGEPKNCGVLLLGKNPCVVDYVATKIMGLNYEFVKQIAVPFKIRDNIKYPLVDFDIIEIITFSNVGKYEKIHELRREKSLKFATSGGWKILEINKK